MSSQAGSCCVEGEVHSGTPVGREQRLYGFDCYVSDPPEGEQPKAVVVILSDVFGWKLHNARILADEYAKRGHFKVMIPDFFEGSDLPTSMIVSMIALERDTGFVAKIKSIWHWGWMLWYGVPWMPKVHAEGVRPKVFEFSHHLNQNAAANLPIIAARLYWGAKYAVTLDADEEKEGTSSSLSPPT